MFADLRVKHASHILIVFISLFS